MPRIRRLTRERFLALYEIARGSNATQVAVLTDRCDESVMAWVHACNEHGPNALTFPRTGGHPPSCPRIQAALAVAATLPVAALPAPLAPVVPAVRVGIALEPLPGYSPDFMPVEALWRWLFEDVTDTPCHTTRAEPFSRARRF